MIGLVGLFAAAVIGSQMAGGGGDPTSDGGLGRGRCDSVDGGQVASTSPPVTTVARRVR